MAPIVYTVKKADQTLTRKKIGIVAAEAAKLSTSRPRQEAKNVARLCNNLGSDNAWFLRTDLRCYYAGTTSGVTKAPAFGSIKAIAHPQSPLRKPCQP